MKDPLSHKAFTRLFSKGFLPLWIAWGLYLAGASLLSGTSFFWDSVSVISRPATFLYDNHFSSFSFPDGTVSDNLPLSVLLAAWWMVFGRTLISTHILFILFGLCLIYQVFMLCRETLDRYSGQVPSGQTEAAVMVSQAHLVREGGGERRILPFVFFLVLADTTLTTQLLIPMFDSVMLLFALMCLRGVLSERPAQVLWGAFILAMLRSRGVFLCAGLGIFALILCLLRERRRVGVNPGLQGRAARKYFFRAMGREVLLFLPAAAVAAFLFAVQFCLQKEVFGLAADSPWHFATKERIFGNCMAFPLFWLDLGKGFLWFAMLVLLLRYGWNAWWKSLPKPLVGAHACLSALFFAMTVPFINSFGGRYFLILYILMPLILAVSAFRLMKLNHVRLLFAALTLVLCSAHTGWYSTLTVKQWDSSLAHLPYYGLRAEMLAFLESRGAEPSQVLSFFPADKPARLIDLERAGEGVWATEEFAVAPEDADYILFSNVSNQFDRSRLGIDSSFVLLKRMEKGAIFMECWQRP